MKQPLHFQKGFTLVELLVVIILVSILAAIAVPLYLHYSETTKVREALGIIKAIITSQKVEKIRTLRYYTATGGATRTIFLKKGIDLSDALYFTYETSGDASGFTVTATATPESGITGTITYDGATKSWSSTGEITGNMLPEAGEGTKIGTCFVVLLYPKVSLESKYEGPGGKLNRVAPLPALSVK